MSVSREHHRRRKIRQAEFAYVQNGEVGIFFGIRAEIPGFDLVFPNLKTVQILDTSDFGYGLGHGPGRTKLLDLLVFTER